jgi:hypothetical protein
VEFDDTMNEDYERDSLQVGYRISGGRTNLNAAIGYTEIGGDQTSDGWTAHLDLTRRISPASTLSVFATRDVGDATDKFRTGPDRRTPIESSTEIASADVYVSWTAGIGWDFRQARTHLALGASASKETHDANPALDRSSTGANATFERLITPLLSLSVGASYRSEDYDTTALENDIIKASGGLSWRVGRRLALSLYYSRYDQDSTDEGATFTENRTELSVIYHFASQVQ